MIDLRSQTPKGRRARERILEAAEQLFVTVGFHGASIRDVGKAAGMPLATVVYHFARKEQLYATVLEAIGEELMQGLDQITPGPPDAQTEGLIAALLRWTHDQPGRVQLLLRELLDNPGRVA